MTGGKAEDYLDDLLEFEPSSGQWRLVDRMVNARSEHAVSIITENPVFNLPRRLSLCLREHKM